jgi:hypothetical protein
MSSNNHSAMSSGEFRGRWLDQINAEKELRGAIFQVGFNVIKRVNWKTSSPFFGSTKAGNAVLARDSHVTSRTVTTALRVLEGRGHLHIIRPAGAEPILRPILHHEGRKIFPGSLEVTSRGAEISSREGRNGFRGSAETSNTSEPNSLYTLFNDSPSDPACPANDFSIDELLNRFRAAYPKRNTPSSQKPIREALAAAIKTGADPKAIIDGANRYASDMHKAGRVGSQYIKSPEKWVREEGWTAYVAATQTSASNPRVFVEVGSPQWKAWDSYWRRKRGGPPPETDYPHGGRTKRGYRFESEWPPDHEPRMKDAA